MYYITAWIFLSQLSSPTKGYNLAWINANCSWPWCMNAGCIVAMPTKRRDYVSRLSILSGGGVSVLEVDIINCIQVHTTCGGSRVEGMWGKIRLIRWRGRYSDLKIRVVRVKDVQMFAIVRRWEDGGVDGRRCSPRFDFSTSGGESWGFEAGDTSGPDWSLLSPSSTVRRCWEALLRLLLSGPESTG